jgi:hypothetical protein
MLGKGYSISQISEELMLDFDTIAKWESQLRREARLQAISELAFAKQKMLNPKKPLKGFCSRVIHDSILFLDGVHPQHNTCSLKAWIKKVKKDLPHATLEGND